jgi:shikimate kinase
MAVDSASERLILLLGPSGVGKSTAMNFGHGILHDVTFVSLDRLARDLGRQRGIVRQDQGVQDLLRTLGHADPFLELGIEAATKLVADAPERPAVIDIGAGFLDASRMSEWLSRHTSVALMAPPEVVYDRMRQRRPDDPRGFKDYVVQEFSDDRMRLYRLSTYSINANCEKEELGWRFARLLVGFVTRLRPNKGD